MDATHPGVFVDRNRCILCARCIRASRDVDKKNAFGFVGRGPRKEIGVNAAGGLGDTDVSADDKAVAVCPVGTLMRKHVGYAVPVGWREFDDAPIGTATEQRRRIPPMHGDR
jgi:[NiFe] hydrogenase diaphorase moiety small subunit